MHECCVLCCVCMCVCVCVCVCVCLLTSNIFLAENRNMGYPHTIYVSPRGLSIRQTVANFETICCTDASASSVRFMRKYAMTARASVVVHTPPLTWLRVQF